MNDPSPYGRVFEGYIGLQHGLLSASGKVSKSAPLHPMVIMGNCRYPVVFFTFKTHPQWFHMVSLSDRNMNASALIPLGTQTSQLEAPHQLAPQFTCNATTYDIGRFTGYSTHVAIPDPLVEKTSATSGVCAPALLIQLVVSPRIMSS